MRGKKVVSCKQDQINVIEKKATIDTGAHVRDN